MTQKDDDIVRPWALPDMQERAVNASQRPAVRTVADRPAAPVVTAEMLQQMREQARHEGYEEGLKNGHRDGLAQGLAEGRGKVEARMQQLQALIESLARPLSAMDEQAEEALVDLALAVAKQLIRRELHSAPGEIIAVVREAVQLLPLTRQTIRVYLHPEDATLVREVFALDGQSEHTWQVFDDPGLSRGGCKVLTDDSTIDATLETRIATVVAHVLGGVRNDDHAV